MANRELNTAVAAETNLASSLPSGATTMTVDSSSSFPAVDFPVVIDPTDDSKREVVIVTAVSGTTWTITRGQDGTSDSAHDANAIVALVPVPALWVDLHDRVEAHTHSGATDGTAIPTANLTGHDKATHDALALDHGSLSGLADFTTDHGTEHDAHDHSAAAASIASADLADHNKAVHDALNIDADTLDGMDSTAFAAVAGDTFTGGVTFEAGMEGSLGTDIHASTAGQSAWPTGLSWQRVTSGTWPQNNGTVLTFNHGNVVQTFQVFKDGGVRLYYRDWDPTGTAWEDWTEVSLTTQPDLWEVVGSTEVASYSTTASYANGAAVALTIPSDWNTWRCEAHATFRYGNTTSQIGARISIDGVAQQGQDPLDSANSLFRSGAVGGHRTGITTVGSATVAVQFYDSAGSITIGDIYLYARAVRTS